MLLIPFAISLAYTHRAVLAQTPQEAPAKAVRIVPLVKVEKNVEYGKEGGENLLLDLYTPIDDRIQLRPGIVFIHGGGWTGGDKAEFSDKAKEMAGRGYVAVTVNYRLAPKHRFPAAVEDVQRAVRWLKSRSTELRLDPDRIGAMGSSAGGHLAAMLGVKDGREKGGASNEPSSRVHCVVDYYGRMDLNIEQAGTNFTDFRPVFIGKTKPEGTELYAEASPITYVDQKTAAFLIVHGSKDPQVEPINSLKMFSALEKVGVEASLLMLANEGHGFKGALARQAWESAKAFLDRQLIRPPVKTEGN